MGKSERVPRHRPGWLPHGVADQSVHAAVIPEQRGSARFAADTSCAEGCRDQRDGVMHALSEHARFILNRMEPDRLYEAQDLRAFVLDTSVERLRDIMHE